MRIKILGYSNLSENQVRPIGLDTELRRDFLQ